MIPHDILRQAMLETIALINVSYSLTAEHEYGTKGMYCRATLRLYPPVNRLY